MNAHQRLVGLTAQPSGPTAAVSGEEARRRGSGRHRAPTFAAAIAAELHPDRQLAFACALVLSVYTLADLAIALTGGTP